jgi:Tol biopolymer transport system component/predicted Ser/Thr protein kinase
MTLAPGARLGPYEVLSPLGSGGMGQVYLARDARLERDVALKVLLAEVSNDPARLKRFENEARSASALNHPNIVTVYDVGTSDSVAWIAMERVEGRTLRELLPAGALPVKRLLAIAVQIADGLARAHEAGIVHRDLKPDNVMLTKDERVKILDFGLAKLAPTGAEGSQGPVETGTFPGVVLGTVGYMSPEQAQGAAVDYRSDQFSLGSVIYEMATGKRAFQGKSAVDTMARIINQEPEPIEKIDARVPGPLRWIVERCLAKDPAHRYTSTQDLAQELKSVRDHLSEMSGALAVSPPRRTRVPGLLAGAAVLASVAAIVFAWRRAGEKPIPDFQRLTFRRGSVWSARFAPDGRTIVYSAVWEGDPLRLFSTRTDGLESRRLDLPDGGLVSVSPLGEIAMLLGRSFDANDGVGTLARVPLAGGAPRELTEGVRGADWSSDGKRLAIVRDLAGKHRLEFPIGKVLYETEDQIVSPRLSPGGDRIAFWASRSLSNATVETVDLAGRHSVLTGRWKYGSNLAWSPDGREVWFTANLTGWQQPLYAVTLSGKVRLVMRLPSWIVLQDISRDGRTLLSLGTLHSILRAAVAGEARERDLSWHEGSFAKGLTPDGKTLLFDEGGEGNFHAIYVRPTDGSPATRLGEGRALAISPDGRWVATNARERGSKLVLLPTGAGDPRVLDTEGHRFDEARFFPDGKRLLVDGDGSWVIDLQTGKLRAVGSESCRIVSPDGKETACVGSGGEGVIYALEGGASRPIPGFNTRGDELLQWSSDGRSLYVGCQSAFMFRVFRLDLATGKRELWRQFTPSDTAALIAWTYYFAMTPDGKSYAYSTVNAPHDLYLVTGLK